MLFWFSFNRQDRCISFPCDVKTTSILVIDGQISHQSAAKRSQEVQNSLLPKGLSFYKYLPHCFVRLSAPACSQRVNSTSSTVHGEITRLAFFLKYSFLMSLIVFMRGFRSSTMLILPIFENSQWWLDPDHSPLATFCSCTFKIQLFCLFFPFGSPFFFFFPWRGRC